MVRLCTASKIWDGFCVDILPYTTTFRMIFLHINVAHLYLISCHAPLDTAVMHIALLGYDIMFKEDIFRVPRIRVAEWFYHQF